MTYVGVDVGKRTCVYCIMHQLGMVLKNGKYPNTHVGAAEFIDNTLELPQLPRNLRVHRQDVDQDVRGVREAGHAHGSGKPVQARSADQEPRRTRRTRKDWPTGAGRATIKRQYATCTDRTSAHHRPAAPDCPAETGADPIPEPGAQPGRKVRPYIKVGSSTSGEKHQSYLSSQAAPRGHGADGATTLWKSRAGPFGDGHGHDAPHHIPAQRRYRQAAMTARGPQRSTECRRQAVLVIALTARRPWTAGISATPKQILPGPFFKAAGDGEPHGTPKVRWMAGGTDGRRQYVLGVATRRRDPLDGRPVPTGTPGLGQGLRHLEDGMRRFQKVAKTPHRLNIP